MAKTRVIFIPWEESEEFDAKSAQWNTASNKDYEIINYDPQETHHDVLVNVGANSSVYIRGHGQAGSDKIGADHNPTGNHHRNGFLDITAAIDRLVGMGLQHTYAGTIKFFNCFSALYGRGNTPALAQVGANYFRNAHGFNHCTFHGYKGPLRSEYDLVKRGGIGAVLNWLDHSHHKSVALMVDPSGGGFWQSPQKGNNNVRASKGRQAF